MSVGVYHFFYCITPWNQVPPGIFETCKFFVDYKIMKNKFCRKIKEKKKELLLYMELSTHLMLKMSGMSTKILHVHEE